MKGKRQFSLYDSHIDLAHALWQKGLKKGFWAIDATCGNGKDTLFLTQEMAHLVDGVLALDMQETAIESTTKALGAAAKEVHLFQMSHEKFPPIAHERPIGLIVYNLGYLPGGDKRITTRATTTLTSIRAAQELLEPGGIISITCYPGHPEGAREEEALIQHIQKLDPADWSSSHFRFLNRNSSPSLIVIQKNLVMQPTDSKYFS